MTTPELPLTFAPIRGKIASSEAAPPTSTDGGVLFKTCIKCSKELNATSKHFGIRKDSKDGLRNECRECARKAMVDYCKANKEHIRELNAKWRKENPEAANAIYAKYRATEKRQKVNREWARKFKKENHDLVNKRQREWKRNQANNIQFVLANRLRSRLRNAIKGNAKNGSAVRDLGCTIDELKVYLEAKFKTGMTWERLMSQEIHIDHIKPLSRFDLKNRDELLKACHYTNLQPLWAEDNQRKSNRLEYT